MIVAAASTSYVASNFYTWGTVSCPGGNNVAWLKCATFDACKITVSNANGIAINKNYWGVQGWEVAASGTTSARCFQMRPANTSTSIHHIIFANDIANGCGSTGFVAFNNGAAGIDYVNILGNIAYNAATNNAFCQSGISVYEPVASDTNAGTHIYVAGNFSYSNLDPNPCNGSAPTDGNGLIFDTWDGSQGGVAGAYTQQGVAYNNIFLHNGGRGVEVFNNNTGGSHATIYVEYNTTFGNVTDPNNASGGSCGEVYVLIAHSTTVSHNLLATNAATGCNGHNLYAAYVAPGQGDVTVATNWLYSASGFNCGFQAPANGFACGTNATGTSPSFNSTSIPGAPSCGSATSTTNCMATVIANFTPTAGGATAYGYQAVSGTSVTDPLFPAWLCSVTNFPVGIITMGCGAPVNVPSVVGVTIQ